MISVRQRNGFFCTPCRIGRYKHTRVMAGGIEGDYFVGKDIDRVRGLLKLTYPMEHGIGVVGIG